MGFFTMNERVALAREGRLPGECGRSEAPCYAQGTKNKARGAAAQRTRHKEQGTCRRHTKHVPQALPPCFFKHLAHAVDDFGGGVGFAEFEADAVDFLGRHGEHGVERTRE